jgi:Sulfotransferase family
MSDTSNVVNEPIFLVGAERSGTTVLRLMLDQHPQLAWCVEFEYAVDQMSDQGDLPALEGYHEWLETHRIFRSCDLEIDPSLDYPELIESFLVQERDRTRKDLVGATVHRHFNRLLQIWSNARFIHIVRDARDVARSCVNMGWAGNVWGGAERWIEAEHLWARTRRTVPAERRLEITYESLISDPVKALTRVCHFMGIPYDDRMLKYPESTSYSLPDPRLIGQWRRKLSEREIQLIEARTSEMLVARGYELSQLPKLDTAAMEPKLKLEDWLMRKSFRVRHYGLLLVAADFVSRRLGLKAWQKKIRLRLNGIDDACLK